MLRDDIVGNWETRNDEGISEERLEFHPDGSGRLVYVRIDGNAFDGFNWEIDDFSKLIHFTPKIWEGTSPEFEIVQRDSNPTELRLRWWHEGDEELGSQPQKISISFYRLPNSRSQPNDKANKQLDTNT